MLSLYSRCVDKNVLHRRESGALKGLIFRQKRSGNLLKPFLRLPLLQKSHCVQLLILLVASRLTRGGCCSFPCRCLLEPGHGRRGRRRRRRQSRKSRIRGTSRGIKTGHFSRTRHGLETNSFSPLKGEQCRGDVRHDIGKRVLDPLHLPLGEDSRGKRKSATALPCKQQFPP